MFQVVENVIPPVFFPPIHIPLHKGVTTMQESFILASAKPGRIIFLASYTWDPLSLYQHNVANLDSG